jgi:transposase-like protein
VIEGYHRQLRKVTKTKSAYPTDEALKKIIYLATVEASKK